MQAKDKGDISNFQYLLSRIPEDYEGRLSEEIIKSREDAIQLRKIQVQKEYKERKEKLLAETKEANDKIIQNIQSVLNNFSFQYDEVQKFKWYHSWEGDSYPPRDAAHWYIIERNGQYKLRAFLVDFDDSVKWVFWDRVVFSTESENWTYFIRNCFAGQSGGGKSTEIVQGGKYETLDVPFSQVEYGYKLLAKGNNPIIRFQSEEAYHDYYLTSESVTEGHPDKVCDFISDSILDACLEQDKESRVAVETFISKDKVVVAGQITSNAKINIENIVRERLKEVGYTDSSINMDYKTCKVDINITKQSNDIAIGVNDGGAGDQGIMFGYATDDSERYIIIKLDEPKYLSALEYVPRQIGNNGRIKEGQVLVSMDGKI